MTDERELVGGVGVAPAVAKDARTAPLPQSHGVGTNGDADTPPRLK